MSVLVITESQPSFAPPGIRRRFEHVAAWLTCHGQTWSHETVQDWSVQPQGKVQRVISTFSRFNSISRELPRDARVIVLGLGTFHMLCLAAYLRLWPKNTRTIVYDTCDSWLLQLKSRLKTRQLKLVLPACVGLIMQAFLGKIIHTSYISAHDLDKDHWVVARDKSLIIAPSAPQELTMLSHDNPVIGFIDRIVVSADYTAFQNDAGMDLLARAWVQLRLDKCREVKLYLYGRGSPPPIVGAVNAGWAANIESVYAGNAAVFIPNTDGSGIPNKLVEALAARRPVIVHESIGRWYADDSLIFSFTDESSLIEAIEVVAAKDFIREETLEEPTAFYSTSPTIIFESPNVE